MKTYVITYLVNGDNEIIDACNATDAHEIGMEMFDADWSEIDVREWVPCRVQ